MRGDVAQQRPSANRKGFGSGDLRRSDRPREVYNLQPIVYFLYSDFGS